MIGRGADAVLGSADLVEDLPRLDGLFPFPIDVDEWRPSPPPDGDVVRRRARAEPSALQGHAATSRTRSRGCAPRASPSSSCSCEGIPSDEARRIYEQADVVVDQLLIGAYAQFAIEGMALGQPRRLLPQPALRRVPSRVGATRRSSAQRPDTIVDELRRLVRDRALREELGARGPGYVRARSLARGRGRAARWRLPSGLVAMNTGLRRLAWQVLVYGSGRLGLQLFSLITLPILTRVFVPAEYGIVETISTFASSRLHRLRRSRSTPPSNGATSTTPTSRCWSAAPSSRRGFWSLAVWSLAICFGFVPLARPALAAPLRDRGVLEPDRVSRCWACRCSSRSPTSRTSYDSSSGRPLRRDQLPAHRTHDRVRALARARRGRGAAYGIYLGGLLAAPIPLFVSWWLVRRTLALDFSRPELRLMLAYALPLLPVAAAAWVMQFADRFFILHYADTPKVGLTAAVRLTIRPHAGSDRCWH